HRFRNRRRSDADAGIVAAEGLHLHRLTADVDRTPRLADARGGLDRDGYRQVLAAGDPAEHAAGVVADEAVGRQFVAMNAALLRHAREAGADLHALDRVDAHHRVGDVGVELVEERSAETHRDAAA